MRRILKTLIILFLTGTGVMAQGQRTIGLAAYGLGSDLNTYAALGSRGGTAWDSTEQQSGMAAVAMPFDMAFGQDTIEQGTTLYVWAAKGMALTADGCIFAPLSQLSGGDDYGGIDSATVVCRVSTDTVEIEWNNLHHGANRYSFQLMLASSGDIEFRYGPLTVTDYKSVAVGLANTATGESSTLGGYTWTNPSVYHSGLSTRNISSYSKPETGRTYHFTRPVCNTIVVSGSQPYEEGFEDVWCDGGLPTACWQTAHLNEGGSQQWSKGYSHHGGLGCAKLAYTYGRTTPNRVTLVSPLVDIPAANAYAVSLWVRRVNSSSVRTEAGVRVFVSTTPDTAGGTLLFFAPQHVSVAPAVAGEGWYLFEGIVPSAGEQYIVICGVDEGMSDVMVDDLKVSAVPNCSHPTGLTWTGSAVTWAAGTATEWQVQDGEYSEVVYTNSYTNSSWQPASSHSVYVRSICGAGDTLEWRGPVSFTLPCDAIALDGTTAYSETFDGLTTSGTIPTCWSTAHVSGPGSSLWGSYSGTAHSGNRMMRLPDMQSTTVTDLVSPLFQIAQADSYEVSLWVKRDGSGTGKPNEGVKVWANNSPDTTGGTLLFHAHRYTGYEPVVSSTGWYEYTATIPLSGTVYIVMQGISEYGNATCIDDFAVRRAPSCSNPEGFAFDDSAMAVTWRGGNAYMWQVEEGDSLTVVYDSAYSNGGWQPNSGYAVRVRSICGTGDTNDWQPVFGFRTPRAACGSYQTLPYSIDFSGYDYTGSPNNAEAPLPDCWQIVSNGRYSRDTTPTAAIYYSGIGQASSTNNYGCVTANNPYLALIAYGHYDGTYESYTNNMLNFGTRKYAVLPEFDYPLDQVVLSMDYRMSARNGAALLIGYIVNDTSDFTPLDSIATDYRVLHHLDSMDFATLADNIPANARIAFCWKSTDTTHTGNAPANYFCGIDNVVVEVAPSCKYPREVSALHVGYHEVTVGWREVSTTPATQWEVSYGATGFDPESEGMQTTAYSDTLTINGLNADVYYDFYVRDNCGAGVYSEWSHVLIVRTECPSGGNVVMGESHGLNQYTIAVSNYGNTIAQSIYTAEELATRMEAGDTISNLVYEWLPGSNPMAKQFTIYMGHTAVRAFPEGATASDWIATAGHTKVYDSAFASTTTGSTRYELDSVFVWNGTDGIVVTTFLNQPEGADHTGTGFMVECSLLGERRSLFARRDHTAYTVADLGTVAPTSNLYRANIVIERACVDMELPAEPDTVVVDTALCDGMSLAFYDTVLTTAGTYSHWLNEDTLVVWNVTVNPTYDDTIAVTATGSYLWQDSLLTESGIYTVVLSTVAGCDSVVTLNLTIDAPVQPDTVVVDTALCDGMSLAFYDTVLTTAGTYSHWLNEDTLVVWNVTVNPTYHDTLVVTATGSYLWQDSLLTESGSYTVVLSTVAGCDSVVTMNLTIERVGVQTPEYEEVCTVFPNPTADWFEVRGIAGVATAQLFDILGKPVGEPFRIKSGDRVDVSHLRPGQYFLRIVSTNGIITLKLEKAIVK